MKSNGRLAWEAYCQQSDGKSLISGDPLPKWDQLPDRIKAGWEAAGTGVIESLFTRDQAAFPSSHEGCEPEFGMSYHQWLVGMALSDIACIDDPKEVASLAVKLADAVIETLAEQGKL